MKKKTGIFLIIGIVLALMLTGCGKQSVETETAHTTEEDKLQIGLSFDSFVIERWLRDRDMFVSTAQSLGAEVNVQVAGGVVDEQISQIEYFIQKKMDVIVIIPIDGDALYDVVKEAKSKGIYVICYDRITPNVNADLYITIDNEMVGTLMGESLIKACPDGGNIFAIYGSPTDKNVEEVEKGFKEALKDSNLDIVYSGYCDNWLAELAAAHVNKGLEVTDDVVGVMCGNDDLASQAVKVLSENRLAGQVAVVTDSTDSVAKLTVYNSSMQQQLVWNLTSEQGTPLRMAFAPDSRRLAVAAVSAVGGQLTTNLYVLPLSQGDPVCLGSENSVPQWMGWMSNGFLLVLYENRAVLYNTTGGSAGERASYDFGGGTLVSVSNTSNGAALLLSNGQTSTAVLLDGELTVGYSGSVLSASQIIRAKNDGFYLLTDSTVERFNSVGEFQWSQPLSARPQALIEGKKIMVLSGNTVQVVTPPEQTASSGQ